MHHYLGDAAIILSAVSMWLLIIFASGFVNHKLRREDAKSTLSGDLKEIKDVLVAALQSGEVHLRNKVQVAIDLLEDLAPIQASLSH